MEGHLLGNGCVDDRLRALDGGAPAADRKIQDHARGHGRSFIQWKPTVLLALAAVAFLGSMFIGEQPLVRRMLGPAFDDTVQVSPRAWAAINSLWVGWFALLAAVNIYVARNFTESAWVHFKVIGIPVAMFLFMLPQVFWLSGKAKAAEPDPPG
jgi:intracellular septation protein